MDSKGELATVMAKRFARQSMGSDISRDSMSSMDIGPLGDTTDESNTMEENGLSRSESLQNLLQNSQCSSAKNFFKAKEQEVITRRASLGQEEILKKEKEDAKRELQEKADKRKAFQQRMAVFNSKK